MTICDDKDFWAEGESEENYSYSCPCLDSYADAEAGSWVCNLGLFKQHDQYSYGKSFKNTVRQDLRPDDCLDAYALRERKYNPDTKLMCEATGEGT